MGNAAEKLEEIPRNNLFLEKLIMQKELTHNYTTSLSLSSRIRNIELGRLEDERIFFKAKFAGDLIGIFNTEGNLDELCLIQGDDVYIANYISSGEDGAVRYSMEKNGDYEGPRKRQSGCLRF